MPGAGDAQNAVIAEKVEAAADRPLRRAEIKRTLDDILVRHEGLPHLTDAVDRAARPEILMLCHDDALCPARKVLEGAGVVNIVVRYQHKVNVLGADAHRRKLRDSRLTFFDMRPVKVTQVLGHYLIAVSRQPRLDQDFAVHGVLDEINAHGKRHPMQCAVFYIRHVRRYRYRSAVQNVNFDCVFIHKDTTFQHPNGITNLPFGQQKGIKKHAQRAFKIL